MRHKYCSARQFAVKAKIYGVLYNFEIGHRHKAPYFLAFYWSPHDSLVSIGQHFPTTRVVHLPKRTETSLITEADRIIESDQAVQAMHNCNSWLFLLTLLVKLCFVTLS